MLLHSNISPDLISSVLKVHIKIYIEKKILMWVREANSKILSQRETRENMSERDLNAHFKRANGLNCSKSSSCPVTSTPLFL